MRRPESRQYGRVPGRGLGDGVILIPVREDGALVDELEQPAGELTLPAVEVVRTELVHGNHDDQLGTGGRGSRRPCEATTERQDREDHGHKLVTLRPSPPPAPHGARGTP